MKRCYLKTVFWLYAIPMAAALLLTAVECFLLNMFYEWFWIPEWLCDGVSILVEYLPRVAMAISIGITGCMIFYQKWSVGLLSTLLPLTAAIVPCLRYCIRHLFYRHTATVDDMMELFLAETSSAMYLLVLAAVGCVILWAVRGFYALVLREAPEKGGSPFSPKHPVGLSALILFGGLLAISAVYFTVAGAYELQNFLSFGLEVVINAVGYFDTCLGAFVLLREMGK